MSAEAVDVRHTASELLAALHEHLSRFREVVAGPVAVSVLTTQEFPVRVELRGGGLAQACAGLLTWFESVEDGELSVWRTADGGTLLVELRGATGDGVRLLVADSVRWHPGVFPGLVAGRGLMVGPMILRALADDRWQPDAGFPAAVADLPGGEG